VERARMWTNEHWRLVAKVRRRNGKEEER